MSKQRQIGTSFENLCRDYYLPVFPDISREDFSSPLGDLRGTLATIECKSHKSVTLSDYMTQVKKSDVKTGRGMPIVIVKKRNANIKDAYFVTDNEHGRELLRAWTICKERGLL